MIRFLADGVLQVDVIFLEISMEIHGSNVGVIFQFHDCWQLAEVVSILISKRPKVSWNLKTKKKQILLWCDF